MRSILSAAALLAVLGGCGGSATPDDMPTARLGYNEAIARSSNEQLLVNLVRLRYLHSPQFFEVTAVTTQSAITTGSNARAGANLGNNLRFPEGASVFTPIITASVGGSFSVEERPTVIYAPLQGEAFAQRMVNPIRPETLFSLVNVGWRIDRLFGCCVTRINDMAAPVIASHDDSYGGARFRELSDVLYELQVRGALEIGHVRMAGGEQLRMTFVPVDDSAHVRELIAEAQRLMGLDPSLSSYQILAFHAPTPGQAPRAGGSDHVVVRGRSLLGALIYLSHGVEVPPGDAGARSLDFNDDSGALVSVGNPVPNALLTVRATGEAPEDSYVATQYQNTWFSLSDEDLESKQVFLLLQVLFSTLSASDGGGPTLTLPVGG